MTQSSSRWEEKFKRIKVSKPREPDSFADMQKLILSDEAIDGELGNPIIIMSSLHS